MLTMLEQFIRPGLARRVIYGAVGGLYGAGAMTAMRLGTRRAGIIHKMVPRAVEEWVTHRVEAEPPGGSPGHFVTDQLLHLAYGVTWGGLAACTLFGGSRRRHLGTGAAFGLGLWAIGSPALLPLLGVARPAWKSSVAENVTNIAAHVLFGLTVQVLTEEAARQGKRRPTSDAARRMTRVG
jgi:hypothetical protein